MGVWEPAFVTFGGLFFEFLAPFTLKGHNFLNFIPFLMIFNALNTPIGGVQFLFKHKKQWNLPFGSSLPWMLKCYSYNSIATNEQLKDLTYILYKKCLFLYVFTFKYMCHFGMNLKKFNLKPKHKIKIKFHGYSLLHLVLCFPTYLPT